MCYLEGDHVKVTASRYPFPTVCKEDQATDWFNSLQNCLHWNKRERQKSFAVVESHPVRSSSSKGLSSSHRSSSSHQLAGSTRNGFTPLNGRTESPPHHHKNSRKSSSSSSVTSASSDVGQDEVFGMFYDDDSGSDRYRPGGASAGNRRRSSAVEDDTSISSLNYESTDSLESDEEFDDYTPDGFVGWTDEEIIKSRHIASISKQLEKL
jgi:hypothetical protein